MFPPSCSISPKTLVWIGRRDAAMMASPPPNPIPPKPTTTTNPLPSLLRATAHLLLWLLHLSLANTLLSLLSPWTLLCPSAVYNLSSLLAASVWTHVQRLFTRAPGGGGARILVAGDVLPRHESAIVLCNHVEWSDFYMVQALALRADMLGRCRWFAKRELKWVPFLGWGLWAMGMPLVSREWMRDERELRRVFDGVARRKWPICTFFLFSSFSPKNKSHISKKKSMLDQKCVFPFPFLFSFLR